MILFGCSSDDSNNSNSANGFQIDGQFYETNFISIQSPASTTQGTVFPARITFLSNNDFNPVIESADYVGYFALFTGDTSDNLKLVEGTYTTNSGVGSLYSIGSFQDVIQFSDTTQSTSTLFYSQHWSADPEFESGNVVINSISNALDDDGKYFVTEINISYRFRKNGREIIGNYNGPVQYTDYYNQIGN